MQKTILIDLINMPCKETLTSSPSISKYSHYFFLQVFHYMLGVPPIVQHSTHMLFFSMPMFYSYICLYIHMLCAAFLRLKLVFRFINVSIIICCCYTSFNIFVVYHYICCTAIRTDSRPLTFVFWLQVSWSLLSPFSVQDSRNNSSSDRHHHKLSSLDNNKIRVLYLFPNVSLTFI